MMGDLRQSCFVTLRLGRNLAVTAGEPVVRLGTCLNVNPYREAFLKHYATTDIISGRS